MSTPNPNPEQEVKPVPARLTDAQCDSILADLVLLDWIGFTRENIRELDAVIQEVRHGK